MPESTLSAHDFPVNQQSVDRVITRGISQMDAIAKPATTPHLAIIVGQPGAGKSTTISRLQAKLQPAPFAIDSDKIRQWHPQINEIFRRDPIRMDVLTNAIVAPVTEALLKHAQDARYNLAIENTLTNPESVQHTIDGFRQQGYRTMVVALAVPEQLSRISIVNRYQAAIERNAQYPRWTTSLAHQNAYEAIPKGLTKLRHIDTITVTDRSGEALYSGTDTAQAAATIQEERARLWDSKEAHETFAQIYKQCTPLLTDPSFTQHDSVKPLVRRIHATASELGITQPGAHPQQSASGYQQARALLDRVAATSNGTTASATNPNPTSPQTSPAPPTAQPGTGMGL